VKRGKQKEVDVKNHTIKIEVKRGKVICDPDPLHVKHNDNVEWRCGKKPFTVYFGLKTPFVQESFMKTGESGIFDIRANATATGYPLEFKYTVAVYVNNKIYVSDPTIIIDP
jgi:hypothetical protein